MIKNRLILASTSPRRIDILRQLRLDFEVISPGDVENSITKIPKNRVIENALSKAKAVADIIDSGLVIGVDTIVYIDGLILEKPTDIDHAKKMLRTIQGKTHTVLSAIALIDTSRSITRIETEETLVTMSKISDEDIELYVSTGEPLDKAGAYAAQGIGAIYIEKVDGCFYNVVGLPIALLRKMLRDAGLNIMKDLMI